jgi:hypothetical protein
MTAIAVASASDLREKTRTDLLADLADMMTQSVLDTLTNIPLCTAVTLQRQIGARSWYVTVTAEYWAGVDEDGGSGRVRLYSWEAREWVPTEEELPDEEVAAASFDTAAEALADADAYLATR